MLPGSFFRRVLGTKAFQYTLKDLRYFGQNSIYLGHGKVLEFYLRLPNDLALEIDDGPLIVISLNSANIFAYPCGTDVQATANDILLGSLKAFYNFSKGLSLEIQNSFIKPKGEWYFYTEE